MLIKANSSTAPATRPLLGTALLALALAGCGGGSDNGGTSDAGASDAGAITPKTVVNGAHQDTSSASGAADSGHAAAGADGQNAAQNGGNAAPADGSAGAAAQPASGATPITEAGISTELFAQILSTQTAYVKLGQRDIPIMYGYRAAELESTNDGQRPPTNGRRAVRQISCRTSSRSMASSWSSPGAWIATATRKNPKANMSAPAPSSDMLSRKQAMRPVGV